MRKSSGQLAHLPPFKSGMRIGLFGGSFNPPHEGHLLVARMALKRLRLDRIWWLVTPGNPLKTLDGLPPLAQRMAAARVLAQDPRIIVTGFERDIGSRYTFDTLRYLRQRCVGVKFVWLMGADNLVQLHHWQRWRDIARAMPIAVIDRPGSTLRAASAPAAQALRNYRVAESDAKLLPDSPAPAFVFIHGRRSKLSSSALRNATGGGKK